VVSTILSAPLNKLTNQALPSLTATSAVTIMAVNLWYPQQKLNPKGLGYLVPKSDTDNFEGALGVFFDSDVAGFLDGEQRGTKLFVLMGGHNWDTLDPLPSEEEGIILAKTVVHRHIGIALDTPCHATATLARDCIPQQRVGHSELMATTHAELAGGFNGKLAVAGSSYTGVGVMPSIRAGYDVAGQIASPAEFLHVGDTGLAQFAGGAENEIREVAVAEALEACGGIKNVKFDTWLSSFLR
jgi:protoporphyrinogen/coproporphyrinogen III oxidase